MPVTFRSFSVAGDNPFLFLSQGLKNGVIGSLLLIQGTQMYISWLGSSQAFLFKAGKTSINQQNLTLSPIALTKVCLLFIVAILLL